MKKIIKNERGVSLVSLAITIIILGIITSMLLYNVKDTKDIERVSNMYLDIETISNRVSNYYSRYGALPITVDVTSDPTVLDWVYKKNSENNDGPLGANDTGNFYVIDLKALENLSLNYGRGFESTSGGTLPQDKDVYIINANSHNIFYLHGIKVNSSSGAKIYYTNQDKDTEVVNIRYIAGIKIPSGFTFKSGTSKNDFIIQDSLNNEYTWANTADGVYKLTTGDEKYYIADSQEQSTQLKFDEENGQNAENLIKSAKEFDGFYYSKTTGNVNYFSIAEEDNWGKPYDSKLTYKDRNGDTAYIPKGFKISKLSSLNTINKGLVIKNDTTQDEYVWINVPDDVLANTRTLEEIENTLKEYAKDYREEGYEDTWYDGCGLTKQQYNDLKNKMLQSIKQNGGFYVGRYEAGTNKARTAGDSGETVETISVTNQYGNPLSQKDKYPFNFVTVAQAQGLSQRVKPSEADYETSLMFGIQWDLVCKFLEETGAKTYDEIDKDSSSWGNYGDQIFYINKGKYYTSEELWKDANGINKPSNSLLTTGNLNRNCTLNIYDLAGNIMELTLEKKNVVLRGGHFTTAGNYRPFSNRCDWANTTLSAIGGFRLTLFI